MQKDARQGKLNSLALRARAAQSLLELFPLLVPPALLGLGAFVERGPLGFDRLRLRIVLPPRIVQRRLGRGDRLVAARALLSVGGLFLASLGVSPPLFLLERRGGFARVLIVNLA